MARFGIAPEDNTGRLLTLDVKSPVYAATISITANASKTYVKPGQLTGALTVNATTTNCQAYDEMIFILANDGTQRIVTFGTNFKASGTVTIPISKKATVSFVFDGTDWVATGREICI